MGHADTAVIFCHPSILRNPYVEAALALGASDPVVLARHVLPNCLSPVIAQGTFIFAAAVLGEAALSAQE